MFFVRAGSEPLLFSLDDLIPSENVVQGDLVENVKKKVPALNITTIYMQVCTEPRKLHCCFTSTVNI